MAKGWIVVHVPDEKSPAYLNRWAEMCVRPASVLAVGGPPYGWAEGATILSTGDRVLYVRETRDEVLRLCAGAA